MLELFARLGLRVFERGWLSSNNVLFDADDTAPPTLVDTGYATHADQTVALVAASLGTEPLRRVVNTHLHSDHCAGNAALHARWDCDIAVPQRSFDAATNWRAEALTFEATGQRCDRFPVHSALREGDRLRLGHAWWDVHEAGGHDPDAVMLFQRDSGVLISGDALWQDRVAVIFPELADENGFGPAMHTLAVIASLAPRVVIPGHGPAFTDVAQALARSRARLEDFANSPAKHLRYARRALVMFHMLEHRKVARAALVSWASSSAILRKAGDRAGWADGIVDGLLADGVLTTTQEGVIEVPGAA